MHTQNACNCIHYMLLLLLLLHNFELSSFCSIFCLCLFVCCCCFCCCCSSFSLLQHFIFFSSHPSLYFLCLNFLVLYLFPQKTKSKPPFSTPKTKPTLMHIFARACMKFSSLLLCTHKHTHTNKSNCE